MVPLQIDTGDALGVLHILLGGVVAAITAGFWLTRQAVQTNHVEAMGVLGDLVAAQGAIAQTLETVTEIQASLIAKAENLERKADQLDAAHSRVEDRLARMDHETQKYRAAQAEADARRDGGLAAAFLQISNSTDALASFLNQLAERDGPPLNPHIPKARVAT